MKRILWSIGVVLLSTVLLCLFLRRPNPEQVANANPNEPRKSADVALPEPVSSRTSVTLPTQPGPSTEEAKGVHLQFRLQVPGQPRQDHCDGKVRAVWKGTNPGRANLDIRKGIALLPTAGISDRDWTYLFSLELDGAPADVVSERTWLNGVEPVIVDCVPRASTIRAFSGTPPIECEGLTLCGSSGFESEELSLPSYRGVGGVPLKVLKENVASPILLENRDGTHAYWIRTSGSAWKRVGVDHDSPGEYRVFLHEGGAAQIAVNPISAAGIDGLRLRLYSRGEGGSWSDRAQAECVPTVDGVVKLNGLGVGEWRVRAEVGNRDSSPAILGENSFTVMAREETLAIVEVTPFRKEESLARLSGLLVLPPELERPEMTLMIYAQESWNSRYSRPITLPLRTLQPRLGVANALEWDAGTLPEGKYRLDLSQVQVSREFALQAGAIHTELVDLVDVEQYSVHVMDEATQLPADLVQMQYKRLDGVDRGGIAHAASVSRPFSAEPFTLLLRPGRYRFNCRTSDGGEMQGEAALSPGVNVVVVEIARQVVLRSQLELVLQCGSVRWPIDEGWWKAITFQDATRQVTRPEVTRLISTGMSQLFGRCVFTLQTEGLVTIIFPELDGFEPIAPVEISVSTTEKAVLPIELVQSF